MQLELSPAAVAAPAAPRITTAAVWRAAWPRLLAVVLGLGAWQAIVSTQLWPDYVLPGPVPVLARLVADASTGVFWLGAAQTFERAAFGYAIALVIGVALGLAVVRIRPVRAAFGSLLSAIQSMPSIAWFPFAILLFKLSETAILFVVVLGAAPSIANGLIGGVDHVPPLLIRSGRSIGARGLALYRHVILPAALPGFLAGLRQAWAFAWRSLMAGELLVQVAGHPALGVRLHYAWDLADAEGLLATMLVILIIGVLVDAVFSLADGSIRRRRGLSEAS